MDGSKHTTFIAILLLIVIGCSPGPHTPQEPVPTFSNPILSGFYPDPSICEANGDFYLVTSSFSYFPGIPIFKSPDLVNWEQIGHVMDRPSQLDTEGQGVSRGLFAPAISYHDGTFYVICTHVDRRGNFIVTAKDPAGPWSDPIQLPEVDGIDPSLFFDEGKTYVVYNSIPPQNQSLYDGHRTIRMYELDETLQVKGEQSLLVNGGVDLSKKPVWIEAPHLYKINGLYYLMCAEGGTAYNHSEVIFRSENVRGPYIPWEKNPILTQRHLNPARAFPITTAGHADLVQTKNGDWWAVFLACRPYGDNYYNIGRETFLAPVSWTPDGWPVINPDFDEVQYTYPTPMGNQVDSSSFQYSGNFAFTDDFDSATLGLNYMLLRTPREQWYELANGRLTLRLRPETASGTSNPSFVGHRQQHHKGSASTSLDFEATAENEKAGLLAFQSENNHYLLCKSLENGEPVVQLYKAAPESPVLLASTKVGRGTLMLKIAFEDARYTFSYATAPGSWTVLKDHVDGTFLSTKVAGGFVGSLIAMYASSNEQQSENTASFGWFTYSGDDEVHKQK